MSAVEYAVFRILRLFRKLPANPLSIPNKKVIFSEYFKDFGKVEAVRGIFGEKTDEVLSHLKVELSWINGYMYVDGGDGHLVISKNYLANGCKTDIYLDLIHELCHVKQFQEGKELFDPHYDYVDRPTEIAAYRYAVKEARRIGYTDQQVLRYLQTEWMDTDAVKQLVRNMGMLEELHLKE